MVHYNQQHSIWQITFLRNKDTATCFPKLFQNVKYFKMGSYHKTLSAQTKVEQVSQFILIQKNQHKQVILNYFAHYQTALHSQIFSACM